MGKTVKKKKNKKNVKLQKDEILNKKTKGLIKKSMNYAYSKGVKLSKKILNHEIDLPSFDDLALYQNQAEAVNQYFDDFHQKEKISPSCQKGCAHCCSYPIFVNDIEAVAIRRWLQANFKENEIAELTKKIEQWQSEIGDTATLLQEVHDFILRMEPGITSPTEAMRAEEKREKVRKEYNAKKVMCPFLKDNSCSIYEIRPVSCRTYFAYGNPSRCVSDMYPIGAVSYECVENNIYIVPLMNKVKVLTQNNPAVVSSYSHRIGFSSKLLPLWFLEKGIEFPSIN